MEPWQIYLPAALAAAALTALAWNAAISRRKNRIQRDFSRKLETVLQNKETVSVICPQRGGNVVLTSKRLLLDTKEGFTALPFHKIKKLQGFTKEGKTTVSPQKMAKLLIKSETDYTLTNTGPEFTALVKELKGKKK